MRPPLSLLFWLGLGWAGLLATPWYGVEGGVLLWLAAPGRSPPLVMQLLHGERLWLAPLLPLLLLGTWAAWARQARIMAWCGGLALGWLCVQGVAINLDRSVHLVRKQQASSHQPCAA